MTQAQFTKYALAIDADLEILAHYIQKNFGQIEYYDLLSEVLIKTTMSVSVLIDAFRTIENYNRKITCDFKSFIHDLSSDLSKGYPIQVALRYCGEQLYR